MIKTLKLFGHRCWQTIKLILYSWIFIGIQTAIAKSSDNPFPSIDIGSGNVMAGLRPAAVVCGFENFTDRFRHRHPVDG